MPRNRIIYQSEGVMVGPAPATGYHFLDLYGNLGNTGDFNLIFPLHRVQSLNYSFVPRRTEIKELGWRSLVANPIISSPEISFDLSYLQAGILNERHVGLMVNYSTGNFSDPSMSDNFSVSLLSGFIERSNDRDFNDLRWPPFQTEPRNFFVPLANEGDDLNVHSKTTADSAAQNGVLCFGNCFLTNYRASAAVNSFPIVQMSYVAENIAVQSSGTGVTIPAIDVFNGVPCSGLFATPKPYLDDLHVSVLRPGDITIDIRAQVPTSGYALRPTGSSPQTIATVSQYSLQHNFNDIKIQSYDISLDLPREALYHVNYKYPLDRVITFPVSVNIGIEALVGDQVNGSIYNFLQYDYDYSITIKCKNPSNFGGIGVQYDFKQAKLINKSSDLTIGQNRNASYRWTLDFDPSNLHKGMWISGETNRLGNPTLFIPDSFLLQEDGNYILQEDGISKIKIYGVKIE